MALQLTRKIADAIEELAAHPGAAGTATVDLGEAGGRLHLGRIDRVTPLAVACHEVGFETAVGPSPADDDLRAWGRRVAERVDYLFERLELQEIDDAAGRALLRSRAPSRRAGRRGYYQVELARSAEGRRTVSLARMAFDESARTRAAVPMQLTVETLERLAEDLGATAHA